MNSAKISFLIVLCTLFVVMQCSEDNASEPEEVISECACPYGRTLTEVDSVETYTTEAATSSKGHGLEYRFDWGDETMSDWSPDPSASHAWSETDTYQVKAQARCATHTDKVSPWSDPLEVVIVDTETVSRPNEPSGETDLCVAESSTFSTGGAACSKGHSVEYRFDWGDNTRSEWSALTGVVHAWADSGHYQVKAQARCAVSPDKVSDWSYSTEVVVGEEVIAAPNKPVGPESACLNEQQQYTTGGSSSSCGHDIEYRFDWDDGTNSGWSTSTTASHAWLEEGTYHVTAEARCAVDTDVISAASPALDVTIASETISTPDMPDGPPQVCPGDPATFSTTGATSSCGHTVEYQFDWGDGEYSVWSTSLDASHTWDDLTTHTVKVRARCAQHTDKISNWSNGKPITVAETVSRPSQPSGSTSLCLDQLASYSTGATSSCGHVLEYKFDWDDGEIRDWGVSSSASHAWKIKGSFYVTVFARCKAHPDVVSAVSPALAVIVDDETVSMPTSLGGLIDVCLDEVTTYDAGGALSSCGHSVEYQFAWANGDLSEWHADGTAEHSWSADSTYEVWVRARCRTHTSIVSDWYGPLMVTVSETVSPPDRPQGPTQVCPNTTFEYQTGGSVSSCGHDIEYRFDWDDGQSAWSSSSVASHAWSNPGTYELVAEARCKDHDWIIARSAPLYVVVGANTVYLKVEWHSDGTRTWSGNHPDLASMNWDDEEVAYEDPSWGWGPGCWGDAAVFEPDNVGPTYNDAVGFMFRNGQTGVYTDPLTTAINVTFYAYFRGSSSGERMIQVKVGDGSTPQDVLGEGYCDQYSLSFDTSYFQPGTFVPLELRVPAGASSAYDDVAVYELRVEFEGWCVP